MTDVIGEVLQLDTVLRLSLGQCHDSSIRNDGVERARAAGLDVLGLMTVGPTTPDPQRTREAFATVRRLADESGLAGCSMGMSGDVDIALAEGSTLVRVGTALFGERP